MHKYTIDANQLAALIKPALPFVAGVNDLPALRCVHLSSLDGYLVAAATDRYAMGIQRVAVESAKPGLTFNLDAGDAKAILSAFKAKAKSDISPELTLTFTDGRLTIEASGGFALMDAATMSWREVGGGYPNIAKMAADPKPAAIDGFAINPTILAKFAAAAPNQPMRVMSTEIKGSKPAPLVVSIGEDFVGAIQPSHVTAAVDHPTWQSEVAALEEKPAKPARKATEAAR